ncbi:uncharacterized protein LOC116614936 [Nematostella vectensis]|uniref:uncharacterized protein LOC116614936 n=1 Tax=Nematostella vectensis TaxID=45351 RepID=UPI0020770D1F|nr:uncharacterized protein LOC116614936 [Nematostella vectensis]
MATTTASDPFYGVKPVNVTLDLAITSISHISEKDMVHEVHMNESILINGSDGSQVGDLSNQFQDKPAESRDLSLLADKVSRVCFPISYSLITLLYFIVILFFV